MSEAHPIGIDFGTTKTLASRWDERSQRPVPIRLGRSRDLLPTTVHIDENGNYLFGEDADDCRIRDAAGYFRRFKRDLGTGATYTFRDGGKATCIDLIAAYLRHVRERIEEEALHGGRIGHAVITVPALYGLAAKGDLLTAVTAAGFHDFSLLEEPLAGGSSFLYDNASSFEGRNFLVFDWGGGTLDLAVVERQGDTLKSHPDFIGGDPNLGGEDIDDALAAMASHLLNQMGVAPLEEQPEEYRVGALRSLCDGKVLLSRRDSHKFYFRLSEKPIEIECSRGQFEAVILPYVERALMRLRQIIAKAEAAAVCLDGILLIGGSSEIPLVSRRITEMTGIQPLRWDYGKDAVGLGAALEAHRKMPLEALLPQGAPPSPPPTSTDLPAQLNQALQKITPVVQQAVVAHPECKTEIVQMLTSFMQFMQAAKYPDAKQALTALARFLVTLGDAGMTPTPPPPVPEQQVVGGKKRSQVISAPSPRASGNPRSSDLSQQASQSDVTKLIQVLSKRGPSSVAIGAESVRVLPPPVPTKTPKVSPGNNGTDALYGVLGCLAIVVLGIIGIALIHTIIGIPIGLAAFWLCAVICRLAFGDDKKKG